ncbi:ferredoxin-type protein NapG [Symbiobacterium terraclitae]|uniref:Ferredoxin-type protein NapG n=1 Tax=Symbiobacterium terraclitae TaxID=557451 RepID=A0ABS4JP96_9FIRM|nr:4Fe-4S dicluster domain-containing protein [Symbiobacterium terraclitae]MBP2017345.1 ferredoxin-type protein NapG [Symbiobacterium terraclitae]
MKADGHHDRRRFFREGLRSLGRLLAETVQGAVEETVTRASGGQRYLRPPGAIEESAFLLACTRCGECVRACPVGAIQLLPESAGAAVGTPFIDPLTRACDLCGKCMPACAPGALLPVADPRSVKMGLARIDPDHCWAFQGSLCDLCYQRCPFPDEAIRLEDGKPVVSPEHCTGCGLCAYVCVSTPPAITIQPRN